MELSRTGLGNTPRAWATPVNSGNEKLVLLAICKDLDMAKKVTVNAAQIALETNMAKSAVIFALNSLRESGVMNEHGHLVLEVLA